MPRRLDISPFGPLIFAPSNSPLGHAFYSFQLSPRTSHYIFMPQMADARRACAHQDGSAPTPDVARRQTLRQHMSAVEATSSPSFSATRTFIYYALPDARVDISDSSPLPGASLPAYSRRHHLYHTPLLNGHRHFNIMMCLMSTARARRALLQCRYCCRAYRLRPTPSAGRLRSLPSVLRRHRFGRPTKSRCHFLIIFTGHQASCWFRYGRRQYIFLYTAP